MFTTMISVNNIYNTSSVVIVPIIWLYMTVVVVVYLTEENLAIKGLEPNTKSWIL